MELVGRLEGFGAVWTWTYEQRWQWIGYPLTEVRKDNSGTRRELIECQRFVEGSWNAKSCKVRVNGVDASTITMTPSLFATNQINFVTASCVYGKHAYTLSINKSNSYKQRRLKFDTREAFTCKITCLERLLRVCLFNTL